MSRFVRIWRTRAGSASAGGSVAAQLELELLALLVDARAHQRRRPRGRPRARSVGAAVDLDAARLDARDVEQVVDEVDEAVGRQRRRCRRTRAGASVSDSSAAQQLDEALDRGQRAAQLVRGGGDELALQALEPRALGRVAHRPGDAGVACRAARR